MQKVIGIGETILDIIFRDNQFLRAAPGGSVFNCMLSLRRCGIPALFISELGNDNVGRLIRSFMEANHLSTEYIDFFEDGQSPVAMAFLDENRDASYSFYKDFPLQRLNVAFPPIRENDLLIFGSYFAVSLELRSRMLELLHYARKQKATLYYDINFRKPHAGERQLLMPHFMENFRLANIIRCSDEDLEILFPGYKIEEIYQRYFLPEQKNVIITQGAKDTLLKTPFFEKSYPVDAIIPESTIGAGDNFNAGFAYSVLKRSISRNAFDTLSDSQWDTIIHTAQQFATEACLSPDNYISSHGLENMADSYKKERPSFVPFLE